MLLRKSLRIRLKYLNVIDKSKIKKFKINESKNKTVVYHYNKSEIIEYFKEMKDVCKENIKNRHQIRMEMLVEKIKEKRAAIKKD
jgi:RNA-splicing ligase RtcB